MNHRCSVVTASCAVAFGILSVGMVGAAPAPGGEAAKTVPPGETVAPAERSPVGGAFVVPVLTAVPRSVSCGALGALPPGPADGWAQPIGALSTEPSDYYAIELVPSGRVPGTRLSTGFAYSTAATTPFFGVAVAGAGEYVHDLDIRVEGLKSLDEGAYVAWVTDTNLENVVRIGALDANLRAAGQATWNKFLVVITLEADDAPAERWQGPVILRGMSRSGRMHTMAGHGPFQAEPCAKYGFR